MANQRFGPSSGNCLSDASNQENEDREHCLACRILHLATVGMIAESWSGRRTFVVVLRHLHGQICGVHYQAMGTDHCYAVADCVAACGCLTTVHAVFGAREIWSLVCYVVIYYDHVV